MSLADERLAYQGRRAELLQEEKALRIRISDLRDSLRRKLNPLAPEEDLPADDIATLALELGLKHVELIRALRELAKIKDLLGR